MTREELVSGAGIFRLRISRLASVPLSLRLAGLFALLRFASLDASQGSYDLSLDGYNSGLKSILDVLNAESDLSNARSQVITSRKELYTSFAQVAYATGTINERTDAARAEAGTIEL